MPPLLDSLKITCQEINAQVPFVTNWVEALEIGNWDDSSEEALDAFETHSNQQSKLKIKSFLFDHAREFVARYLQEHHFSKDDLTDKHKQTLKSKLLSSVRVEANRYMREAQQDAFEINLEDDLMIHFQDMDSILIKILNEENLLTDQDEILYITKQKRLGEHRNTLIQQFNVEAITANIKPELKRKAFLFWQGIYFNRVFTDVGFCGEQSTLGLVKLFENFELFHQVDEKLQTIDFITLSYYNAAGGKIDSHVFLGINLFLDRDRTTCNLKDIASWGPQAILFDPWNKLVIYTKDLFNLPKKYLTYDTGPRTTWESIIFTKDDVILYMQLTRSDLELNVSGYYHYPDRYKKLLEEYQLHSLHTPQFEQTRLFLQQIVDTVKPAEFNTEVLVFITTLGKQLVRSIPGFDRPAIAIHLDFLRNMHALGKYHREELAFGICNMLYHLQRHGSDYVNQFTFQEQTDIDELTLQKCQSSEAAISFLRKSIEFQNGRKTTRTPSLAERENALSKVICSYEQRIKALMTLLAQQGRYILTPSVSLFVNDDIVRELANIKDELPYYREFYRLNTDLERVAYLTRCLPELKDELIPYELEPSALSLRVSVFCELVSKIDITHQVITAAVSHLIKTAFNLRVASFRQIYLSIPRNGQNLALSGPFEEIQAAIADFVSAQNKESCLNAAEELASLMMKYSCLFDSFDAASEYTKQYIRTLHIAPTGDQRYFGSKLGKEIVFNSFISFSTSIPWEKHLIWASESNSNIIAKTLWRLGVVRDRRVWKLLGKSELRKLIDSDVISPNNIYHPIIVLEGNLAPYGDRKFLSQTQKELQPYLYALDIGLFATPSYDFEEAFKQFYDTNKASLFQHEFWFDSNTGVMKGNRTNEDNESVNFLLTQFCHKACHGSPEEQQVVKSFFLGRPDNRDLWSLCTRLYNTSPFFIFFIEQRYKNTSFQLWSTVDYVALMQQNKSIFTRFDYNSLQTQHFYKLFVMSDTEGSLERLAILVKQLAKTTFFSYYIFMVITDYVKNNPCNMISNQAAALITLLLDSGCVEYLHSLLKMFGTSSNFHNGLNNATPQSLIIIYRAMDSCFAFPNNGYQTEFARVILQTINHITDLDTKKSLLEKLVFKCLSLLPITDTSLRKKLIQIWVDTIVFLHGKDPTTISNQSETYIFTLTGIIDSVLQQGYAQDSTLILRQLLDAIEAQASLCHYVGEKLEPEKYFISTDKHIKKLAIAGLATLSQLFSEKQQDQYQLIDFLSTPLSTKSVDNFATYVIQHNLLRNVEGALGYSAAIHQSQSEKHRYAKQIVKTLYDQFWERSLEERSLIINHIIIPAGQVANESSYTEAYQRGLNWILNRLFPNQTVKDSDDEFAAAFLHSYLASTDQYLRPILLAALLVTANNCDGTELSAGKKLAFICEVMGPAYIKLLQAIHSHPDTPATLRDEIAHVKSKANPPTRWQIWRMIDDVVRDDKLSIKRLGKLLGSASYNIALEIECLDSTQAVLTLLRENAEHDARGGFKLLSATIQHCQHHRVAAIRATALTLIEKARQSSEVEMDHQLSEQQFKIAKALYTQPPFYHNGFKINIFPIELLKSGPGYRFVEFAAGTEFNDLPEASPREKALKKAVAYAVIYKEFLNILQAKHLDRDRHGNQMRVYIDPLEPNTLVAALYDFGEMSLEIPCDNEVKELASIIKEVTQLTLTNAKNMMGFAYYLNQVITQHIAKTQSTQTADYLIQLRKALLALQDFIKELSPTDLIRILIDIAKHHREEIHPELVDVVVSNTRLLGFMFGVYDNVVNFYQNSVDTVKNIFTTYINGPSA